MTGTTSLVRVTGITAGVATLAGIYKLNRVAVKHDQAKLTEPASGTESIPWTAVGASAVPLALAGVTTVAARGGIIAPQAAMGTIALVAVSHFAGMASGLRAN